MIRRLSKNNDYRDIVSSCPAYVIDDISVIKYFISGHPEVEIEGVFERVGRHLEVILPSQDLQTLPNGILMRKAFFSREDSEFPDGSYNLEMVESLDVWLGEDETDPFTPGGEYLTASDLKTINNQSIVGQGNITIEASVPDYYATKSWVSEQGYAAESWVRDYLSSEYYMTESDVNNLLVSQSYVTEDLLSSHQFATESWVQSQGYITSTGLSGLATQSWVLDQGYITSETLPEDIATQSWVSTNFLSTTALTGYATEDWVSSNYVSTTTLSSYTTFSDIDSYVSSFWYRAAEEFYNDYVPRREIGSYLSGYATESWVQSQGYLTSVPSGYATESWVSTNFLSSTALSGYATEEWVNGQGFVTFEYLPANLATEDWVLNNFLSADALYGYATESWVSTNFLSATALTGYATESWVQSQGYLTSHQDLTGYATESWVSSQGYLSAVPAGYATESWVSTNFLSTTALTGYATESWVSSQGYLTSHQDLTGYATESWVQSQGYLTEHQDLSSYATQSWATSQFLEESKVWTGTQSQWNQLTSAQKATYTIALITE